MPVDERSETMQSINQYSFLILGLVMITVLVLWRLREGFRRQDWVAIAALVVGFMVAFGIFRPTSQPDSVRQFEDNLGQGEPLLLSLQSPYCLACMSARPFLDRVEEQHPDLTVVRLNIQDPAAADILDEYGFQYTPTFIMFDSQGEEMWRRPFAIDPEWVDETLESLP
jgi:thiol-disulfide isomerase/thioredoxin